MRILIVHNAYPQYGGEDTVVANETAMLKKHGLNVVPWIVPTKETGLLNLIRCGLSAVWNPTAYLQLKKIIAKEQPDIVHCHNLFPLLSPSIVTACNHAAVPVVQTIHNYRHICPAGSFFRDGDICEECLKSRFPGSALRHACYRQSRVASAIPTATIVAQRLLHTLDRKIDALIALNRFGKEKLMQGGIPEHKIRIKPNFCPEPTLRMPEDKKHNKPLTFCFAGRLSIDKGIPLLLDAWKKYIVSLGVQALAPEHQPRLLIAGSGELTGMVTEASQQYGSIQYRGPLSHADSLAMVARSDALVCPSIWYEGMPMTILEAFSLGKPVIASSIGALPEMVEHEKNGWVFLAGSSSSLEACIHDASTNRERPAEYGKNAIKKWRRCYSEEVNFELLMKIYRTYI